MDLVGPRGLELHWASGEAFQCVLVGSVLFGWFKPLFLKRTHRRLAMWVSVNMAKKSDVHLQLSGVVQAF